MSIEKDTLFPEVMHEMQKTRPWAILAAGAAIQVLTGLPAAWGVFQRPVMEEYGLSEQGAGYAFGVLIAFFGIGCVIGGFLQDKQGPRFAALWGTGLLCGGFFAAAALPAEKGSAFFGVFSIPAGLGTAFLYPSIQSCAQKWYKGRKGLATGVIGGAVGLSGAFLVRELIQNALDATKMQLYRTLSAYGFQFNEKTSPFDVERAYPNIFEEHAIMIHTDYSRETGKVYFSIRDKGIGISMDEFKRNILTTGRSWPERKEYQDEIKRMPEWLRPTGAFGIGLHTVFSVTDSLTIRTKSDSENKANEMTLYSGKKGGYAFCKKTNQTLQRGSEFSFSFLLTEELKEWVTGSNGGKLFLENVNDGIQKEIKKIMETWCVTPMVSIYADQDYGIPAFSQSTWYNELSRTEKENQLIDQSVESERYHFAFTDDYRSIMVWDREKDCALSFGMESMEGNNVCYKGIRLTERMESGKCSDSLYLNQMDVLDGAGNDWVDAARMKLSLAARRKLESVVEEATAFAKRIYVFMLDEFYQDNDIRNLTNDIDAMAN